MLVVDDGQGMIFSLCRKHAIWVTPYPGENTGYAVKGTVQITYTSRLHGSFSDQTRHLSHQFLTHTAMHSLRRSGKLVKAQCSCTRAEQ